MKELCFGFVMRIFAKVLLLTFCLVQASVAEQDIVLSALTLDQATQSILGKNKTKVLGAKTELIKGKKVHVIKILTSEGRVQYIKIDVDTGKSIK